MQFIKLIKIKKILFITILIFTIFNFTLINGATLRELSTCNANDCGFNWNSSGNTPKFYMPANSGNTTNEGGCTIDLSYSVSCNANDTKAILAWGFQDNLINPVEEVEIILNRSSTAVFDVSKGDKKITVDKTLSQFEVDVEPGMIYATRINGINDGLYNCNSNRTVFTCENSRPTFTGSVLIQNDNPEQENFEIKTTLTSSATTFIYAFYNKLSKDSNGNILPVCIAGNSGYQGECPNGSYQLLIYDNYNSGSTVSNLKVKYSDIYKNDVNKNNEFTDKLLIKVFVKNNSVAGGLFSKEDVSLTTNFSISKIIVGNFREEANVYTNLGRFRIVGDWIVDMTPPETSVPVSSNYLYDSFDTEWKVKTETPLLDSKFGCYKLTDSTSFDVAYLGYLNEVGKYVANNPLFSTINNSFSFITQTIGKDVNGNNIVNPLPFPNCVNSQTIDAFKAKVNQPANLAGNGVEVGMKTKFKLTQPENFENFQHIFKATDLACNTSVSEPGGAGMPVPSNWISTDGGTVQYGQTSSGSPVAPATSVKIDSNLYCTYDYNTPASSRIFYGNANTDNALINISKSLLFNDIVGKSFTGAKENEYTAGDDILLGLMGDNSTHFSTLLNQVKSQTSMITSTVNTLDNIAQTGCSPDDDRCYVEINGNTIINGDDGTPQIDKYFCDRNAMFFINGDLTVNDNIYKSNNIDSCCGFIVSGNINFVPTNSAGNYNKTRYEGDYLTRNDVDWYNTYECATGFYYSEKNISIQSDKSEVPMSTLGVNLSDPLMLRGDLLAKGNIQQGRTNGIGNLSRPAVYLTKDTCIMNNFPELSYVLLQTRDRDFEEAN